MTTTLRFVWITACVVSDAQCSGPGLGPAGPSSIATPGAQSALSISGDVSSAGRDSTDSGSVTTLAKEITSLAGDWRGTLTLRELDGTVVTQKFAVPLTQTAPGVYQATDGTATLTLSETSGGGYSATMATGETQFCTGNPVVYTGTASLDGKKLSIALEGISDDCTFEEIDIALKYK